eukprot:2574306-Rhodomonas_salina.1
MSPIAYQDKRKEGSPDRRGRGRSRGRWPCLRPDPRRPRWSSQLRGRALASPCLARCRRT